MDYVEQEGDEVEVKDDELEQEEPKREARVMQQEKDCKIRGVKISKELRLFFSFSTVNMSMNDCFFSQIHIISPIKKLKFSQVKRAICPIFTFKYYGICIFGMLGERSGNQTTRLEQC